MSIRLAALNLCLRIATKRRLARISDPAEMRELLDRQAARLLFAPSDAHLVEDRIARRDGAGRIDALWCSAGQPDRRRVILYLHGGAFIAGSPATHRGLAAALGGAAGARALVPDYRLAPEHPLPAATEDALDVYRDLLRRGIAPGRIALAGDSAGGGLAFLLAARIAAEGLPAPAAIVAFSPWCDLAARGESIVANASRDPMLPAQRMAHAADMVRGSRAADDGALSAVEADWPRTPPPSLIFVGRDEILLDDAKAMARKLAEAGGSVRLEVWPRVPHGWPIFLRWIPHAEEAVEMAGAFIAARFALADGSAQP
jgi:acetyl esterase/lipase